MGAALLIIALAAYAASPAEPGFEVKPPMVIHFGASWCAPCIAELPWISDLDLRYRSRGLTSVLVSFDEIAEARALSFPVVIDRSGAIGDRYRVKDLPHLILIDANGEIALSEVGLKASVHTKVEAWLAKNFPEAREDREEEVTFEEEVDRDSLKTLPPIPEYRSSGWLVTLPVGCALLIAWNVDWRGKSRRARKERRK